MTKFGIQVITVLILSPIIKSAFIKEDVFFGTGKLDCDKSLKEKVETFNFGEHFIDFITDEFKSHYVPKRCWYEENLSNSSLSEIICDVYSENDGECQGDPVNRSVYKVEDECHHYIGRISRLGAMIKESLGDGMINLLFPKGIPDFMNAKYSKDDHGIDLESSEGTYSRTSVFDPRKQEECTETAKSQVSGDIKNNLCMTVREAYYQNFASYKNYYKKYSSESQFSFFIYRDQNCVELIGVFRILWDDFVCAKFTSNSTNMTQFEIRKEHLKEVPKLITNYTNNGVFPLPQKGDYRFVQLLLYPSTCTGLPILISVYAINLCTKGVRVFSDGEKIYQLTYSDDLCTEVSGGMEWSEGVGFDKCQLFTQDNYFRTYMGYKNSMKFENYYYDVRLLRNLSSIKNTVVFYPVEKDSCNSANQGKGSVDYLKFLLSESMGCYNEFLEENNNLDSIKFQCNDYKLTKYNYSEKKCGGSRDVVEGEQCTKIEYEKLGDYYYWVSCVPRECFGKLQFQDGVCSNNGICVGEDTCQCNNNLYTGDKCQYYFLTILWIVLGCILLACLITVMILLVIILIVVWKKWKLFKLGRIADPGVIDHLIDEIQLCETSEISLKDQEMIKKLIKINPKYFAIKYGELQGMKTLDITEEGVVSIYEATYNHSPVIVKFYKLGKGMEKTFRGANNLMNINSSNCILNYYGATLNNGEVGCVFEKCESIQAYFKRVLPQNITPKKKLNYMINICKGMEILHEHGENGIMHRNLGGHSVVITHNHICKLWGFEFSKEVVDNSNTAIHITNENVIMKYKDPNLTDMGIYDKSVDIFSVGILFWEIFLGFSEPFPNVLEKDLEYRMKHGLRPSFSDPLFAGFDWLEDLIERCLDCDNVSNRPSFEELLKILKENEENLS